MVVLVVAAAVGALLAIALWEDNKALPGHNPPDLRTSP